MTPETIRAAAIALASRRLSGQQGPLLEGIQAPQTITDAMAIQQAVSSLINDAVAGWKCGMPAPDKVVIAPIYATTLHQASPCPVWLRDDSVRIEPELAFVFGHGLPLRDTPYTDADIRTAITRVHLALELLDSRFEAEPKPGYLQSLADGLVNQGLLLGPQVDPAVAFVCREMPIRLQQGTRDEQLNGVHPAGDPLAPLYWLVRYLAAHGQAILPGQTVITGSYAGAPSVQGEESLTVQFGELGEIRVSLQAR